MIFLRAGGNFKTDQKILNKWKKKQYIAPTGVSWTTKIVL